jgi:Ca2+-binding EF-hand superfamily protein
MNANIQAAEQLKAQHLQQSREAQNKLLLLFEAADINGDGVISINEFVLAEVWWLRCTMNPERDHLF